MAEELESGSDVVDDGGSDIPNEPTSQETPSEETAGDYSLTDPDSIEQRSAEEAPAPQDPAGSFDSGLLAIAEQLGYSRDVAMAFSSEEALKRHLHQDTQNRLDLRQHQEYAKRQQFAYQQQTQQPQQQEYIPYQIQKYDLQLDSEAYAADDPLVQQLNAMNEHYRQMGQDNWDWIEYLHQAGQAATSQFEQHQQMVYEQAAQQQQSSAYQSSVETFDRVVGELDDYADVLGTGKTGELQSSEQWGNRDRLYRRWATIEQEYRNAQKPLPPDKELALEAAQSLFGAQSAKQDINGDRVRDPVTGQYVQASRSQRPTNRKATALPKGVEKAARNVEAWFHEREELLNSEVEF